MNSGKIIIGLSLVMFSVAMMVSPSDGACTDTPGCGSCGYLGDSGNPGTGQECWYPGSHGEVSLIPVIRMMMTAPVP